MSNPNKQVMSPSSNSSFGSTKNTSKLTNLGMKLKQKFGQNMTVNTPSRISIAPFQFKTFDANTDICAVDEDFNDLYSGELEFKNRISPLIDVSKIDVDVRENLIGKVKKIGDTYELSNEVFYNSVLLNDLKTMAKETRKSKEKKRKFSDLFDFTKISNGDDKGLRYETFFEAVSGIIVGIKFYEYEKESPLTKEILDFFDVDGLINILNRPEGDKSEVTEDVINDVIYNYIKAKQVEILMKIKWGVPTVNIKHFIDHYLKILPSNEEQDNAPGTEYSRFGSPSENTEFSPMNEKVKINKANQPPSVLLKEINKEIGNCINSIGNLSPLLPDYSSCNFSELALGIIGVTVSFSFKGIAGKIGILYSNLLELLAKATQSDIKKLLKLKEIYIDWIQQIIDKYTLNKDKVFQYNRKIKDFLAKVNKS